MFKPLQILRYATPMSTRKRLVQAISKPTHDDTSMVRMVPGDPTTIVEVPLGHLDKALGTKADYKYIRFARVSGMGHFPEDMLRYDSAYLYDHTLPEEGELAQPILIWTVSRYFDSKVFTPARWASFGWQVEEIPSGTLNLEYVK